MKKIQDEYTDTCENRQYAHQLRKLDKGICAICTKPRVNANHCEEHAQAARQRYSKADKYQNCLQNRLKHLQSGKMLTTHQLGAMLLHCSNVPVSTHNFFMKKLILSDKGTHVLIEGV